MCLFSCGIKPKERIYTAKISVNKINTKIKASEIKTDVYFGIQHVRMDSADYFVSYWNHKLKFSSLLDKTKSFEIDFANRFLVYSGFLICKIKKDNFYVLDGEKKTFTFFKIDFFNKKAEFKKAFIIPTKLSPDIPDCKAIRFGMQNTFEVIDSNIYLAYNNGKAKENYFDENSFLVYQIKNDNLVERKSILPVPKRFREAKTYMPNFYIQEIFDSLILYTFSANDSIYTYNHLANSIVNRNRFSNFDEYNNYNKKKDKDLSYSRKFYLSDEMNVKIVYNELSKKILIIKRVRKDNIMMADKFEYYLLNENLEVLLYNKFDENINHNFVMAFNKGFLILDKVNSNQGFYYE